MHHIDPLVSPGEFALPEGVLSYQATPLSGPAWKSQSVATREYQQTFARGTTVLDGAYAAVKSDLRTLAARMVGCSPNEITFAPNATGALNTLIGCMVMEGLGQGDNIITPSNTYSTIPLALSRLERLGVEIRLCGATTEEIIAAIDSGTRLIAIEACNYVTCKMFDLEKIAEEAHQVGARIVIDVSQVAGVIPLSLAPFDAMFGTAGKWLGMGSNGIGLCWVNRDRWPDITPETIGWYSVMPFNLPFTGVYELREDGQRLETGGLPWPLLYNLRDALRNLIELYERLGTGNLLLGQQKVEEHVKSLGDEVIAALDELGLGLTVLSPRDARQRGSYISVKMTDEMAKAICTRLNERGVYLSYGQGRLRFGPWIFNGSGDVRLAVHLLGETLREIGFDPHDPAWVGRQ